MSYKVVIADDEKPLAETLSYAFKREGYEVYTAYDGRAALQLIESIQPELAILDVNMPYLTGFDILKKQETNHTMGIILLTAKTELIDKVLGLEFGADDYITKPFEMREVLARASALIRRISKTQNSQTLSEPENTALRNQTVTISNQEQTAAKKHGLYLDYPARMATLGPNVLELTPKEFEVLWLLYTNPQRVFTRENILDQVWDMDYEGGTRTVDIHIQRLRKKLGMYGEEALQTVYKVGYKWVGNHE